MISRALMIVFIIIPLCVLQLPPKVMAQASSEGAKVLLQDVIQDLKDKLQIASQNAVSTLTNAAGQFQLTSTTTTTSSTNFALPMTGTAALGFAIGFMRA
jgi:hypothetical protein